VAERLAASEDPRAALRGLHGSDLYLACACAAGPRRALADFEREILAQVPRYIKSVDGSASFGDEVAQALREKLFVGQDGGAPKILDYGGKGPLGSWVRVTAIRTARNLRRRERPAVSLSREEGDIEIRSPVADPELGYLTAHYRREFRDAFEKTLATLSSKERNILRLYFLEGMNSGAVAQMYDVTGATVRLWIKQWREAILAETRRRLATRLHTDSSEVDRMMNLLNSRFDLTVSRMLKTR
jgi:RNA polymerase sigma-70 factor (ECF subfamily)